LNFSAVLRGSWRGEEAVVRRGERVPMGKGKTRLDTFSVDWTFFRSIGLFFGRLGRHPPIDLSPNEC